MQIYHDASEREPGDGDGDNSRSEESTKLAGLSQARYLVIVGEALGLTYKEILDSSYSLISAMMDEYSYVMLERNKTKDQDGEIEGKDFTWIELPDFDTGKMVRMKKYDDIAGKVKV